MTARFDSFAPSPAGGGHHPSEAVLLAHGAGSLGRALSLVVEAHLAVCEDCRKRVAEVEALGGVLLDDVAPAPLEGGGLTALLDRLDDLPPDPARAATAAAAAAPAALGLDGIILPPVLRERLAALPKPSWQTVIPGVAQVVLEADDGHGASLRLLRVAPGLRMPEHGHGGAELALVLGGGFSDAFGSFGPGDVSEMDPHTDHRPVADPGEDCICLVAVEGAVHFRGPVLDPLQRLLGGG